MVMKEKNIEKAALVNALPALRGRSLLVIGDLFLDEYIVGRARRLSREAPVPVLEFTRRFYLPGGAANPAHNITALGSTAHQIGIIGDDEAGQLLADRLREARISTTGLVTDPSRPTTTKTRIVAEGTLVFPQQLARIDRLERRPLDGKIASLVIGHLREIVPRVEAVLLSDYKSGVATEEVIAACLRICREQGKLLTVDSQGDLHKFRGFDLVKCNRREAEAVLGRELRTEADFQGAGEQLLAELESSAVLITRGDEGMSLASRDAESLHIPAANRSEVFDITGAGDTVIAVVTLAMVAGLSITEAVYLANYAAGLVVRKLGNATATQDELAWAIRHWPVPQL
jgi:rfaE bifunctional protein kinase chain/domain